MYHTGRHRFMCSTISLLIPMFGMSISLSQDITDTTRRDLFDYFGSYMKIPQNIFSFEDFTVLKKSSPRFVGDLISLSCDNAHTSRLHNLIDNIDMRSLVSTIVSRLRCRLLLTRPFCIFIYRERFFTELSLTLDLLGLYFLRSLTYLWYCHHYFDQSA